MNEIIKTNDYTIFKKLDLNRDLNKAHLRNLEKIILKNNYLELHPILCNEKMEVIDGQHRLEICKKNGIPIYYIQSTISDYHVLDTNLYQKKLSIKEVVNFYAIKEKKESYITLLSYLSLLNINIRSLFGLLFGSGSYGLIDLIKNGNFVFPPGNNNLDEVSSVYLEFLKFVEFRRITPFSMFKNFNFCIAFRNLLSNDNFKYEVLKAKLEQRWFDLKPQIDHKAWYSLLVDIYNYKNQSPL